MAKKIRIKAFNIAVAKGNTKPGTTPLMTRDLTNILSSGRHKTLSCVTLTTPGMSMSWHVPRSSPALPSLELDWKDTYIILDNILNNKAH